MDKEVLPSPVVDADTNQDLAVDKADSPESWESISHWLNIPLDPEHGTMFEQISVFLQTNTIASGQETISWTDSKHEHRERVVPTADVHHPQADYWGVPMNGWWLIYYTHPDGSTTVEILAEMQDIARPVTRTAEVKFTRRSPETDFRLEEKSPYHAVDSPYVDICSDFSIFHLGVRLDYITEQGGSDAALFHVYNKRPSLAEGETDLVPTES